jgi:hypothetical protein
MSNPQNNAAILSADTTAIGIAYVTSDESLFGGYFVVITARP